MFMLETLYRRSYVEVTYLLTLRADIVKESSRDKAFQSVTNILLSESKFLAFASVVLFSPVPCGVFHIVNGRPRLVRMYNLQMSPAGSQVGGPRRCHGY